MTAQDLINLMPQAFVAEKAGDTNATIQYNISNPMYTIIRDGECTVHEGTADDFTVAMNIDDDDLVDLLKGDLDGVTAFMTGKLQLEGDIMFAQQVPNFFDVSKVA